jgi:hypothetical protein
MSGLSSSAHGDRERHQPKSPLRSKEYQADLVKSASTSSVKMSISRLYWCSSGGRGNPPFHQRPCKMGRGLLRYLGSNPEEPWQSQDDPVVFPTPGDLLRYHVRNTRVGNCGVSMANFRIRFSFIGVVRNTPRLHSGHYHICGHIRRPRYAAYTLLSVPVLA